MEDGAEEESGVVMYLQGRQDGGGTKNKLSVEAGGLAFQIYNSIQKRDPLKHF